jgi:hypothetical protein
MGMPLPVQRAVEIDDRRVDPGMRAVRVWFGAGFHDARKGRVKGDPERVLADAPLQAFRNVEGVKRQDAARIGIDEKKVRVIARIRHREHAPAIAIEQFVWAETGGHEADMVGAGARVNAGLAPFEGLA